MIRSTRAICVVLVVFACGGQPSDDTRPDMIAYAAKMEEWKRDSAVIDSLARLVNIDSLVQLRRAVLAVGTERPYRQASMCEFHRLSWRHGRRPAAWARRWVDSAFTSVERRRFDEISSATGAGLYEVSNTACGPMGQQAPEAIAGVSLSQSARKPRHPDSTMPPRQ